jgi:general nucleoside transport system permease protein
MNPQKSLIAILPLLAGLAVALVIIAIILKLEDSSLREVGKMLYEGSWEGANKRARVVRVFLPLLLCSSGLLLTFTSGLWNIGIEGQLMMGAVGATMGALFWDLPNPTMQVIAQLLMAAAAGSGWALLAGILKTRGGVNEIFGGVALNSIASLFSTFLIGGPWAPAQGGGGNRTAAFDPRTLLPAEAVERAFISYQALAMAIIGFLIVAFLLYFTRFGLQLNAMGKSTKSANALGAPTERNIWLAMALCGALAGLGGSILVLYPPTGQLQTNISGGVGFLALLVVLLASVRAWLVPIIAFTFAFLNTGSQRIESGLQIDSSLINVLQGVLVLAVLLFDGVRTRLQAAQEQRMVMAEAARLAEKAESANE